MSSYKEIIKSSGIIGLVQIVKIVFGLIQNKVLALLVGTSGFGIWGMYNTYIELVSSFSSLGLDASGVRQIAKKTNDPISISKCIWIFKRALLIVSIIATILSVLFSKMISLYIFDTEKYYNGVIAVSFVILLNAIWKGNVAILNGLRNLRYLALSQILGAIVGALVAVISIIFLGQEGIPLFIIATSLTMVIATWRFVRKLRIPIIKPCKKEIKEELKILILMGLGFSFSGIVAAFTTYLSRYFLISKFNIETVGIYQASWTISNLYIGTILTAMGIDFMPRLMKVIDDNKKANSMISEQLEFGILASSIGVLGILIFSPLVLNLFYSQDFIVGTPIIRWQVLGVAMRVFGFVFGYVIMAHNKPLIFVLTQSFLFCMDLLLLVIFANIFGFLGLGINYFVSYFLYVLLTYPLCIKYFQMNLGKKLLLFLSIEWGTIILVFILSFCLDELMFYWVGLVILLLYIKWIFFAVEKYLNISLSRMFRDRIKR